MNEIHNQRPNCHAVINVEAQSNNFHWVAAGEASIWTISALTDFCRYAIIIITYII